MLDLEEDLDVSAEEIQFPVPVGEEITVHCVNTNKVMKGSGVLTCQIDGLFGHIPSCSSTGQCFYRTKYRLNHSKILS